MDTTRLDLYAAENHGLLTRAAAARAGMSSATWYRALDDGRLISIHPNVARMRGTPSTREQRIAAAVFAAGKGAMASHRSAAHVWGVPRPEGDPVDLIVVARTRGIRLDGVVVHRPRDQRDLSPVRKSNIATSNVLRFLCDLGAVDEPSVSQAVGHVVTNGIASPQALLAAVQVHARRGRHGVPALRAALSEWVIDGKPVDSVLEKAMCRLLTRHKLPQATFHARVAGFEFDFLITGTPIVLECDGWSFHGRTRMQFERDRERDAALMAAGYVPVHFTYWQITKQPTVVARRIEAALHIWSTAARAAPWRVSTSVTRDLGVGVLDSENLRTQIVNENQGTQMAGEGGQARFSPSKISLTLASSNTADRA
ncbi:type IV toxin-antitoxin system AbiEi family antitoxin domain-containing protein [soil metagenome]